MTQMARGTFEIELHLGAPELGGAVSRREFTKRFIGDLEGTGAGLMLSCGDPEQGSAGYVAIETVEGSLAGKRGHFALQQLGMMDGGAQRLDYEVVPGSGRDELRGLTGRLELTIERDGTHRFELEYSI